MTRLHILDVQRTVADYYGLERRDMTGRPKPRRVVRPRQIAMTLAREFTAASTTQIGKAFGGRDHSTVCHAVETIISVERRSGKVAADLNRLREKLQVMVTIRSAIPDMDGLALAVFVAQSEQVGWGD